MSKIELNRNSIYVYLMALLAMSMPLSVFACSLFLVLLIVHWFVSPGLKSRIQRLKESKALWLFLLFYFIHVVGLLWTRDLMFGLKDLNIKLPLLLLPLVIVSEKPLSAKQLKLVLMSFIAANIFASFLSIGALIGIFSIELRNFREASLFIGHIRFSLMLVLSFSFSAYYLIMRRKYLSRFEFWFFIGSMVWIPAFLTILKSLSGLIILLLITIYILWVLVRKINGQVIRFMLLVFMVLIPLVSMAYISASVHRFYSFDPIPEQLDSLTIQGNAYDKMRNFTSTENGHYVWMYVCKDELKREWEKRSDVAFDGHCRNGEMLKFTLIRYLSSKGLRKDAAGISRLSVEDVKAIEDGIANYIFLRKFALYPRIYESIWEIDRYKNGVDPNDKSIVQRYIYLQAGLKIAATHLFIGDGTGDVKRAFDEYYETIQSPLRPDRRRRAHNQFLTLVISLGLLGLALSLFSFLVPVSINKRWHSFLVQVFLLIMFISMLNEDTLENTPGVFMFSFFYAIFILNFDGNRKENEGSVYEEGY